MSRGVSPAVALIKAHAYGNDFLLVEAAAVAGVPDMAVFARRACDRHRGIGADGLLVVRAGEVATRTGSDGWYFVRDLPPGPVEIAADGAPPASLDVPAEASTADPISGVCSYR